MTVLDGTSDDQAAGPDDRVSRWIREATSGAAAAVVSVLESGHDLRHRSIALLAMAREYDAQLLESVAVRRNRLRESLLWGRERRARATMDNLKRLMVSVVLAAVASAGCVGWSFLQDLLAERQQQNPFPAPVTATR